MPTSHFKDTRDDISVIMLPIVEFINHKTYLSQHPASLLHIEGYCVLAFCSEALPCGL